MLTFPTDVKAGLCRGGSFGFRRLTFSVRSMPRDVNHLFFAGEKRELKGHASHVYLKTKGPNRFQVDGLNNFLKGVPSDLTNITVRIDENLNVLLPSFDRGAELNNLIEEQALDIATDRDQIVESRKRKTAEEKVYEASCVKLYDEQFPKKAAAHLPQPVGRSRAPRKDRQQAGYSSVPFKVACVEQDFKCCFCFREVKTVVRHPNGDLLVLRLDEEHLLPRGIPGSTDEDNIHAACQVCNMTKSDHVFTGFDDLELKRCIAEVIDQFPVVLNAKQCSACNGTGVRE